MTTVDPGFDLEDFYGTKKKAKTQQHEFAQNDPNEMSY
jgi:hypothetical protein